MQPLDRAVFGPFKRYYNTAADEWLLTHPGRPLSIYDMAELVGKAYPLAFTNVNICKGFEVNGIVPLNENIFTDDEFLSSYVTDRALPELNDSALSSNEPREGANQTEVVSNAPASIPNLNLQQVKQLLFHQKLYDLIPKPCLV